VRVGYYRQMILVAVDDFLFRSKIRATAKHTGVEVSFARTAAEVLEQARTSKPSLVILDLNSTALEPIETLGALKADAALAGIPTLGFVSHVDTARIQAARQAGADQVMARSAFAGQLAEILLAGTGQP
jgi:DNA-binding NarL/FixJ family response regulator